MSSTNLTDEELMAEYVLGNSKAFDQLYQRHQGRLFSYFKGKTHNPQIAGDLLQETFLKLHRSRHLYKKQCPFLPWIFTVARNVFIDDWRKRGRDPQHEPSESWETIAASGGEALETLGAVSVSSLIPHQVAQQLTVEQQKLLNLRYLEDWSFEEIAQELETTPVNIRQMLSRVLKKIRLAWPKREDV